ncbi:hypothetical protein QTP88_006089 [Uroleucon formosanum]
MPFRSSTVGVTILVLLCWSSAAAASANHHKHTSSSCTDQTVRMRPDNYMRCLLHFGKCVQDAGPYHYDYYDALRRNVADSCWEFMNRPDVLPAARRLVYDTANLYLQRIGQTVYRHEMGREAETPSVATAAATKMFPPAHTFIVVTAVVVRNAVFYLLMDVRRKITGDLTYSEYGMKPVVEKFVQPWLRNTNLVLRQINRIFIKG